MKAGHFASSSTMVRLLLWFMIMVVLTMLVMVVFYACPDHTSTLALKALQFFQTCATFLMPPFIVAYLFSERPLAWLGWRQPIVGREAVMATVLIVVAMPGINLLGYWNSQLSLPDCLAPLEAFLQRQEEAAAVLTERFLNVRGMGALAINIVVMALLPAFAEELSFRGVLNNLFLSDRFAEGVKTASLKEYGSRAHVAIWLTAIIFSAIHMQFYGFVPRMLLGALFGYMLLWTGSLWIPILMHAINNGIAVVFYYIAYQQNIDPNTMDIIGSGDTLWLGILSLVLTAVNIYLFRRSRTMNSASSRIS